MPHHLASTILLQERTPLPGVHTRELTSPCHARDDGCTPSEDLLGGEKNSRFREAPTSQTVRLGPVATSPLPLVQRLGTATAGQSVDLDGALFLVAEPEAGLLPCRVFLAGWGATESEPR